ncbi:putative tyrosine protein phosphatase MIH1 KNAG_0M02300 [Huiozyma naganishii CBS 8797]|uniref:M-phase inducer phosphatase n=1 Tax=Huiozyma naganishii (strain ATCC MYA-139 / BCRC 22969 / CBS 8797 / KCTC 17520 / NBRC 10181 / NCYC 3082 / Yp74L-3) TaxID=1071383 RepID=J7RT15_HUIN7|nr:hypothetical protein KNAG_0M02300 [Kazachstania naganishii CBS 8797]CCK73083.1 hypothetical protein KNAG_0M02300 [Kazachstania naganishii CBS 8797]
MVFANPFGEQAVYNATESASSLNLFAERLSLEDAASVGSVGPTMGVPCRRGSTLGTTTERMGHRRLSNSKSYSRKNSGGMQRTDSIKRKELRAATATAASRACKEPSTRANFISRMSKCSIPIHHYNSDGTHCDDLFPRISTTTLRDIIVDKIHEPVYSSYCIVDCRFKYEYSGGHIRSALNISSQDDLERELLLLNRGDPLCESPTLLIFYCEFSARRSPAMAAHLRNCDRIINQDVYPGLYYPDVVILDGGYKSFYSGFPSLCDPISYVTMDSKENLLDCETELDKFRLGSKKVVTRSNSLRRFHSTASRTSEPGASLQLFQEAEDAAEDTSAASFFSRVAPPPKLSFQRNNSSSHSLAGTSGDENSSMFTTASSSMGSASKMLLEDHVPFYSSFEDTDGLVCHLPVDSPVKRLNFDNA